MKAAFAAATFLAASPAVARVVTLTAAGTVDVGPNGIGYPRLLFQHAHFVGFRATEQNRAGTSSSSSFTRPISSPASAP